uniref:Uncharacterized protein n=1 Tax=Arundo donax TaxID=35708 RepID=A0A0A9CMX7_ARUDO
MQHVPKQSASRRKKLKTTNKDRSLDQDKEEQCPIRNTAFRITENKDKLPEKDVDKDKAQNKVLTHVRYLSNLPLQCNVHSVMYQHLS